MLQRSLFSFFILLAALSVSGVAPAAQPTDSASSCGVGALVGGNLALDLEKRGFKEITNGIWAYDRLRIQIRPGNAPRFFTAYGPNTDIFGYPTHIAKFGIKTHSIFFVGRSGSFSTSGLGQGPTFANTFMMNEDREWVENSVVPKTLEEILRTQGFRRLGNTEIFLAEDVWPNDHGEKFALLAEVTEHGVVLSIASESARDQKLFLSPNLSFLGFKSVHGENGLHLFETRNQVEFILSHGRINQPKLHQPVDGVVKNLGITPPVTPAKEPTGFIMGGINSTATIRAAKSFNSIPVEDLTRNMRPDAERTLESSNSGFLSPTQELREVMAMQNDYVLGRMRSNHQIVAGELKVFLALYRHRFHRSAVEYRGRKYSIQDEGSSPGPQYSPFRDKTGSGGGFYISRLDAQGNAVAKVLVTPTVVSMIERWGFYEGSGLQFSTEVKDLFEVLDYLKP